MNKNEFMEELEKLDIKITQENLNSFEKYKELIQEYNQKFNLTTIVEDKEIYLKHFYDSLYLLTIEEVKEATSILDIGTGAGLPGIPLAILLPNTKIILVESNTKKCGFLNIVKNELKLKNVEIINKRAEEYTKYNKEKFDIVTSRAVANLMILSELEIPALKINGYFLPLKSNIDEELKNSEQKIENLGGTIEKIIDYVLPIENSKRTIIKIQKTEKTKDIYPREYSKIKKDTKNVTN